MPLTLHPGLWVRARDNDFVVRNPVQHCETTWPLIVRDVLAWATGGDLGREELAARAGVSPELVDQLIASWILVNAGEDWSERLLEPPERPIGHPVATIPALSPGAWAVIGAPVDLGSECDARARNGPAELRGAFPWSVDDDTAGLVDFDLERRWPPEPLRQTGDLGDVKLRIGEGLESWGARLYQLSGRVLEAGHPLLVLGGDHATSWFALRAALERHPGLSILHLDAHHDMYDEGITRLSHANLFLRVLAHDGLGQLVQVGLRTMEAEPSGTRAPPDARLTRISTRRIRREGVDVVLDALPDAQPCWISIDADVLAPHYAPETGSPVAGGMSCDELCEIVDRVARSRRLIGADLVEVASGHRTTNLAASAMARAGALILMGRAPFESL